MDNAHHTQAGKLKVVLCWHMHQPHYRDGLDGIYRLPWVYLHAIKDYADMAWHLEACPDAKVVVNFAPVLLEQIDDYAQQMRAWLADGSPMNDPMLNLLVGVTPIPKNMAKRIEVIQNCLKAHAPTMIDVFPAYKRLVDLVRPELESEFVKQAVAKVDGANKTQQESNPPKDVADKLHSKGKAVNPLCLNYLNDQFFTDLLVWYHLAWLGISLRELDPRVKPLMDKRSHFTDEDKRLLMEVMQESMASIIPRYKALLDKGQIEISMTPYGHPIVPLLLDFQSMHDALPDAPAPMSPFYPGGKERADWHMQHGLQIFNQFFHAKPQGVWLSEGALSEEAVALLDDFNIKWTASGEGVWRHSCESSQIDQHDMNSKRALYQPLRLATQNCSMFFRDDGLSDLIGFQYKDWHADDAAADFASHLSNIAAFLGEQAGEHVVSVILDGENAWEYYPVNASHFISALYKVLSEHPSLSMTTFSEVLDDGVNIRTLPTLKAGSWVYGSFSTWIGEKDKNLAWDLLVDAKACFDEVIASGTLTLKQQEEARLQLGVCEGSDWFWWFGDYNASGSVKDFDCLYRRHLKRLYELLGKPAPNRLDFPISLGGGHMENAGTMRRN
ncbi:glycoside hydrolase family 57 protein [Thiomicrorhabdus sediminis]|uniref:Glycoside hydrolase n=1 Tax=Thiomicrorhabdus sediminis TaxID=2580412 RepID=A0A4P9K5K0_9GAMM|nr:glycoside hydrolase family 57 protein [Thiomicrorhabdus sediminis]QCU89536.1 glycoside hydrolase [Thiomicrorhabdus sediminis]